MRLRALRHEEWSDLGLAALAIGLALLATQTRPDFALPLFLGGVAVACRGVVAAWRRWDIVDSLAADSDAYAIPEVRRHALREATIERRRLHAAYIRHALRTATADELGVAAFELESLVEELEDDTLTLDATCAVACARLVSDPSGSPLLSLDSSPEEVRARVRHIRSGFASHADA